MYYFIVLHCDNSHQEGLLDALLNSKHIITYEHGQNGDNPHYHIILETLKSTNYISNMLRQKFCNNRPKSVSCKQVKDMENSILYIIKDLNIVSNTMCPDEEMATYLAKTIQINHQKKQKKVTEIQEIVRGYNPPDIFNLQHCINYILECYDKPIKAFSDAQLQRVINAICNRHYKWYIQSLMFGKLAYYYNQHEI